MSIYYLLFLSIMFIILTNILQGQVIIEMVIAVNMVVL